LDTIFEAEPETVVNASATSTEPVPSGCAYEFSKGAKKGTTCGKKTKDNEFCSKHNKDASKTKAKKSEAKVDNEAEELTDNDVNDNEVNDNEAEVNEVNHEELFGVESDEEY
jgi:hypothetical protein